MDGDGGERVLVDCGHTPWRTLAWMYALFALLVGGELVLGFWLPQPASGALIASALLMLPILAWSFRPRSTLMTTAGISSPSGRARWAEIAEWEMYNAGKALTLVTRSDLLRIDALTLEVLLFKNQDQAEKVLRERVPNGRVLP